MEPWFDAQTAGAIGGVLGGVGGAVFGGIGGPMAGYFAPRGKHKALVLGFFITNGLIGLALLVTGLVAVFQSQPSHVYSPFFLVGFILALLAGVLTPVIHARYRGAEERLLDAEQLRAT